MKNFRYLILAIIVFLLVLCVVLFKETKILKTEYESLVKDSKIDQTILFKSIEESTYFKLPEGITVSDSLGREVPFESLAIQNPVLIFRTSWSNCESCVKSQIETIESSLELIQPGKVFVLTSFESINDMVVYKKHLQSNLNFINIKLESLKDLELEGGNSPYFFVLNKDRTAKMIFIPLVSSVDLSQNYLRYIRKNYLITNK
nr:hypothetical protein [uncultured Pedobacter sp.]